MESPITEQDKGHVYPMVSLSRINKQQQRVDDLLCRAVANKSVKAVSILLDLALTHLKLDKQLLPRDQESDLGAKWMDKRDIKPLILAAQGSRLLLTKMFLARGFKILPPHDIMCECQKCQADPLAQSKLRIDVYKAICNPVWISLTSIDPFITVFQLCHELERLNKIEDAYENEYASMCTQCQDYCTDLLDCVNTTEEQHSLMNMKDSTYTDGQRRKSTLGLLKKAIHYKQKRVSLSRNSFLYLCIIEWSDACCTVRTRLMYCFS